MPDSKLISKEERHAAILERLMQFESVLVTDLAAMLNVSLVTIRKDLTELEKASKLYRSHGKAGSAASLTCTTGHSNVRALTR